MKVLLCSVSGWSSVSEVESLPQTSNGSFSPLMPHGPLRILSSMEKNGYSADIYDINSLKPSDEELIKNFKLSKPTVVGLSAPVSHCYPNVKRISKIFRELFPDIWIVVGGHLTGSSNVVLRKTEADICVIGDGEIPFLKLLEYFKLHPARSQINHAELCQIKGLAFIDENNKLQFTGHAEQFPASQIYFPDLDKLKLGLQKYGGNGELIHDYFSPIEGFTQWEYFIRRGLIYPEQLKLYMKYKNENKKSAEIFSSKGCVARCTFCQRARKGYSACAPSDLENHLIELNEKYNVRAISFAEENFGSDKKQSYEIARIMKKHDFIWSAQGVRCTSVTYEDLKFYKEHNLLSITFGIESGSQKILDIMEKKCTKEDVHNAIANCEKAGIKTIPSLANQAIVIIGMPGETEETVIESAQFVASLRFLCGMNWNVSPTHLAMAIPGTPLYEYCQQIGVIGKSLDEEEDYLIRLSEHRSAKPILNYVNKTDSNIKEVHYWTYLYRYACKKEYADLIIKNNKSIRNRLSQIYEKCIKGTFKILVDDFNLGKQFYKKQKFLKQIKWYTLLLTDFLLTLGVLFLPKIVFFPILRVYANSRLYNLRKKYKVKEGKLKNNLFYGVQPTNSTNKFRITEDRIAKMSRQAERSLRNIVMENRKQMKPAMTDEEKGLQILAQGR